MSSTIPFLFAQASAFRIFMPHEEIVPAILANKKRAVGGHQDQLIIFVPLRHADFRRRNAPGAGTSGNERKFPPESASANTASESHPENSEIVSDSTASSPLGIRRSSCWASFARHVQALVVHGTIQIIFRGGIELPQHLRLPGRERFRVHGLDIRVGEQSEHLQVLDRAHSPGKIVHGLGIKNVPPHQRRGHSQMVADQKIHRFPARRNPGANARKRLSPLRRLPSTWLSMGMPFPTS